MVSDFLVQHPSGPFFSLSEKEYRKALRKYPQVSQANKSVFVRRNDVVGFPQHILASK